jgi:hypothetical protein
VRPVPVDWEFHSLSGGHIHHITGALKRLNANRPYTLVVMVGVNNRACDPSHNTTALESLAELIRDRCAQGVILRAFATGVSIPSTMLPRHRTTLFQLNSDLRMIMGEEDYVPPLPQDAVHLIPKDPVHYTRPTVIAILDRVTRRVRKYAPWTFA